MSKKYLFLNATTKECFTCNSYRRDLLSTNQGWQCYKASEDLQYIDNLLGEMLSEDFTAISEPSVGIKAETLKNIKEATLHLLSIGEGFLKFPEYYTCCNIAHISKNSTVSTHDALKVIHKKFIEYLIQLEVIDEQIAPKVSIAGSPFITDLVKLIPTGKVIIPASNNPYEYLRRLWLNFIVIYADKELTNETTHRDSDWTDTGSSRSPLF